MSALALSPQERKRLERAVSYIVDEATQRPPRTPRERQHLILKYEYFLRIVVQNFLRDRRNQPTVQTLELRLDESIPFTGKHGKLTQIRKPAVNE